MKECKSILEFDNGSIEAQTQQEFAKVLANIADINTSTKPRTINIKLELIPDDKRKHIEMKATITSKLQPSHPIKTSMQLEMSDTECVALELTPYIDGQKDLFGNTHEQKMIKFEDIRKGVV